MKRRVFIFMGALILCGLAGSRADARDDWQYWHSYVLKAKMSDDFSFKVSGEQRLLDDFTDSGLANISPGFLWHPNKHIEIGPFFKYERSKTSIGNHVNERRWLLEGTLKTEIGPVKVTDRNRIAYRDRNTSDQWRYRKRIKVDYPLYVEKLAISPFVSEEIFWQINSGSLSQNRIQVGAAFQLTENTVLSLYYMLKSDRRGGDWDDAQVLGTTLGLSF